jgi:hypothetical protein
MLLPESQLHLLKWLLLRLRVALTLLGSKFLGYPLSPLR